MVEVANPVFQYLQFGFAVEKIGAAYRAAR